MLEIDGRAGGGQLLRTALSLSAITGTPFRVEDVRGERPNPGLRPQHSAAVDLVAACCDGETEGAEPESDTLVFRPGEAREPRLSADIGTAGSVTLLFDTVLPIAAVEGPLTLTATGGTDVKWSPPIASHRQVKLPLLARSGLDAAIDLARTGFYPAGGGEATLRVRPSTLAPLDLRDRGELQRVEVYSKAAESLESQSVADRQATHARETLAEAGFPVEIRQREHVPTRSPGSSILLRAVYEGTLAGFDALGERGVPSEEIAARAIAAFETFHEGAGAVDRHMADQLLVFLALAGGRIELPAVTDHVETNAALLGRFESDIDLAERPDGTATVTASGLL